MIGVEIGKIGRRITEGDCKVSFRFFLSAKWLRMRLDMETAAE
jgi:hypothetical protein